MSPSLATVRAEWKKLQKFYGHLRGKSSLVPASSPVPLYVPLCLDRGARWCCGPVALEKLERKLTKHRAPRFPVFAEEMQRRLGTR